MAKNKLGRYAEVEVLPNVTEVSELGMWKDFKFHLKKTDGDLWFTEKPILTKKRFFCYKYVILHQDGSLNTWENGVDRIADLEILEEKQCARGSASKTRCKRERVRVRTLTRENHCERECARGAVRAN